MNLLKIRIDQIYPLRSKKFKPEEYEIDISNHVLIKGGSLNALKMAKATLLQLSEKDNGGVVLPIIKINDYPDAEYRGLLIDLARKWHSVETIKKIIDLASFIKLIICSFTLLMINYLPFPLKTFLSFRQKTITILKKNFSSIVNYSYDRGVILVPEIDVPGHSMQFVKKYPEIFQFQIRIKTLKIYLVIKKNLSM